VGFHLADSLTNVIIGGVDPRLFMLQKTEAGPEQPPAIEERPPEPEKAE